ncbi:MAG: gfo/Idh/MocA family oxidoreductase, partial [Planctomycetaceae bacterium]
MAGPRDPAAVESSTVAGGLSRRGFVAVGAAAGAAVSIARGANVAGSDRLKVGLVGCGGRGSG